LLFVPGQRPERFEKAARSGADAIILDLEDSVPAGEKAAARTIIERDWERVESYGVPVLVRMNSADIEEGERDLAWLSGSMRPAAVMVPKVESVQSLTSVGTRLGGIALLPIIESAAGYQALSSLAAVPGVMRLVVGHLDFVVDAGFNHDPNHSNLSPLRFAVAIATRVSRLASPVDGVTTDFRDDALLRTDVERASYFGFGGKLCIHPAQIDLVHQAMQPSGSELAWARKIMAAGDAAGGAAVQVDGQMVDRPVVLQARRILERAALSRKAPG
jgi:citrate lyase subunit beta / citryl-CoA lyase